MSIDQLLNKAWEKGLGDFRSDYGYDENCGKHKELLANAKKELFKTLKTNDVPDYDDPFIVDAYIGDYHRQHCRLAFWVFDYFLIDWALFQTRCMSVMWERVLGPVM